MVIAATLVTVFVVLPVIAGWFIVAQPSRARNQPSSAVVDPVRLETHVRRLAEDFAPRDHAHPENLEKAAAYIEEEFRSAGARVSSQHFHGPKPLYRNVSGFFGPDETAKPRLIIGAHYDAFREYPGADDNASAVAGLIELAHLIGNLDPRELAVPVELVSWPLEEPPNFRTEGMGSAVHASSLKKNGVEVRLMIALEMIGYFSDRRGSQGFPNPVLRLYYPSRGNFIAVTGDFTNRDSIAKVKAAMRGATALPVHSISAPRALPGIDFSDHLNYWNRGYPALMITDTAFYRNRNYHSAGDTPDTLDYARMGQTVVGVFEAVRRLAREP